MRLNSVKILKISITTASKKTILEEIEKYLDSTEKKSPKSLKIYTPNTEQLVRAQWDDHFAKVLDQADVALPDSGGVVWASNILTKQPIASVIPGVEFMEDLVALAAKRHVPIGLIGGRPGLAVKTLECLREKYPGTTTSDAPRIVFVALGAPKQEFLIDEQARKTDGVIYMAVGGSFDIIAGLLPRAPAWVRRLRIPFFHRLIGSEFLWRLMLQPWRIFRQLALIKFVFLVLREKVRRR